MSRRRLQLLALLFVILIGAAAVRVVRHYTGDVLAAAQERGAPTFEVDPFWPKLPDNWTMGQVSGIAVDGQDHIWVVNRPNFMKDDELGAQATPKAAVCCVRQPFVIEFDQAGHVVQGWGGPGDGYEWPSSVHGVFVDHKDHVWIGGNGQKDNHVLKFTRTGKFVMQIGRAGQSQGSNDTQNLNAPAGLFVDRATNELFVGDGYRNRRVVVFDADTGAYRRHWGAFGNRPDDAAPRCTMNCDQAVEGTGPPQFSLVHGVTVSKDGIVYVMDRPNNRIQSFTRDGKFVREAFIARSSRLFGTSFGGAFSPDPQQRFLYVPDGTNDRVWILNRDSLQPVGSFGRLGRNVDQFYWLHSIAVDSKGNIYTGEAGPGQRVQRFLFKGFKATD